MIRHAKIEFNESGTPVAQDFADVYFSNDNGLLESDYVFFQQNNIASRWQHHPRRPFVIAETGFGTGLNFLNTWQRFNQDSDKSVEQLHFISFEKFPLKQSALQQALAAWPELTSLSEQLVASYPTAIAGCHRLEFDQGRVILDLWFAIFKTRCHSFVTVKTALLMPGILMVLPPVKTLICGNSRYLMAWPI